MRKMWFQWIASSQKWHASDAVDSPKWYEIPTRLHGVMSQKIVLFTKTANFDAINMEHTEHAQANAIHSNTWGS